MDDSQDYWYETPKIVIALYDFIGTELEELSIAKGVEYQLLDTTNKQWWLVRNRFGGEGFVPSNYVVEKPLVSVPPYYEEVNDEVDEKVDDEVVDDEVDSNDEFVAPVYNKTSSNNEGFNDFKPMSLAEQLTAALKLDEPTYDEVDDEVDIESELAARKLENKIKIKQRNPTDFGIDTAKEIIDTSSNEKEHMSLAEKLAARKLANKIFFDTPSGVDDKPTENSMNLTKQNVTNQSFVAVHPFTASGTTKLSLKEGEEFEILSLVKNKKGEIGYVPSKYLKNQKYAGKNPTVLNKYTTSDITNIPSNDDEFDVSKPMSLAEKLAARKLAKHKKFESPTGVDAETPENSMYFAEEYVTNKITTDFSKGTINTPFNDANLSLAEKLATRRKNKQKQERNPTVLSTATAKEIINSPSNDEEFDVSNTNDEEQFSSKLSLAEKLAAKRKKKQKHEKNTERNPTLENKKGEEIGYVPSKYPTEFDASKPMSLAKQLAVRRKERQRQLKLGSQNEYKIRQPSRAYGIQPDNSSEATSCSPESNKFSFVQLGRLK